MIGDPVPGADDDAAAEVRVRATLADGELSVRGRMVDASNATLLARVGEGTDALDCVYKPVAGERPLWDFPEASLSRREVAAHLVSVAAGWSVVPPTVFRDGPFGPGSVQCWIRPERPVSPEQAGEDVRGEDVPELGDPGAGLVEVVAPDEVRPGWLPVVEAVDAVGDPVVLVHADDPELASMAVFDVVANNADRKGGHVLRGRTGPGADHLRGVDHGLTFHDEPKLRTILWGWTGRGVPEADVSALRRLRSELDGALAASLAPLLRLQEVDALVARVEDLLADPVFPGPDGDGPAIPWPAF